MSRLRILLIAAFAALTSAAVAQTPATPETPPASSAKPSQPFGAEVTLPERIVVYVTARADVDNIYGSLVAALKQLRASLDKEGIAPTGPAMARYRDGGENGFEFEAAYPVAQPPKNLPEGVEVGHLAAGKALEFVHRGSFTKVEETYSAIDDFFRTRQKPQTGGEEEQDALADAFEEYTTDPLITDPEHVEMHILVPIK
jgi:effector-binding domain-containing protein